MVDAMRATAVPFLLVMVLEFIAIASTSILIYAITIGIRNILVILGFVTLSGGAVTGSYYSRKLLQERVQQSLVRIESNFDSHTGVMNENAFF